MRRDAPQEYRDADLPDAEPRRGEAPPPMADFSKLAGSVVGSGGSLTSSPAVRLCPYPLTWMKLPDGFCSHYYATVPETRQLRFSPSGDLFVASPSTSASGGAQGGMGAIVVLPDDNHDGVADSTKTYLANLPTTQALLFHGGYFYYQDNTLIRRTPYKDGDRKASGVGEQVVDVNVYTSTTHWSKALDADDDGNIYVTNGGDNDEPCGGRRARLCRGSQVASVPRRGSPDRWDAERETHRAWPPERHRDSVREGDRDLLRP